ncbi:MAG TPA: carboxymuconolactone decarboxylase family protein [Alphaproteobacteria bacterium]|nr:carboxymuconolactone decarboxylase family protein [Alphaproteobacteria bacterium]
MNNNQMDSTQRIKAIEPGMAKGKAKVLLDAVVSKYGGAPNSFKTMAHSPAVLEGFLGLSGTLEGGVLPFETRYQIAIAVSEINGCPYCLSAFTAIGKSAGMKDETLAGCRIAGSPDPKIDAILKFAAAIVRERGAVTPDDFQKVKSAGCSDEEIQEIVANVALFTFANYINLVIGTEIDFPLIMPMKQRAAGKRM